MSIGQKENKAALVAAITVASICVILYLPALRCGFVTLDDPEYVLHNPLIQGLDGSHLAEMFFRTHIGWWMPLTWLSLAIDYQIWGLNPTGFHLTNILLHALNTGLVVLIIDAVRRVQGEPPPKYIYAGVLLTTALFFGAHPLKVESVVWVTERKDVLNGFFALCSIFFYLRFVERKQGTGGGSPWLFYGLSFLCFTGSLMAKSVTVVLPAMLLILDWLPLGRLRDRSLRQLVMEKWPFWGASCGMVLCTLLFAAQSQYLVTYQAFPLTQRLAVSGNAIWEYVRLLLFPVGLSPFNVIPDPIPASYGIKAGVVALALVLAGCGIRKVPGLTACLLCFLLPLFPVLAFFQNGDQSFADRFTYLPSLSPAFFLAFFLWSRPDVFANAAKRSMSAAVAALVLITFMVLTARQLAVWRSPETLLSRIVEIQPITINYKERGRYYQSIGRYDAAIADFTAALHVITGTLKPYEYNFYAFRGEALLSAGRNDEAVSDFTRAITLHPHPVYYYHRGLALQALGRTGEAESDFRNAGPKPGSVGWIE